MSGIKKIVVLLCGVTLAIGFVVGYYYIIDKPAFTEGLVFQPIDNGYSVIGYEGTKPNVVIPPVHNDKPVVSIGEKAFYYFNDLESITIPNSVTSIGAYAFAYCRNLTSITMADSVTSIGYSAFSHCSNLISIIIPRSVISIGAYAFDNCNKLVEIFNLSTVENVGYDKRYDNMPNEYTSLSAKSKLWTTDDGFIFYEDGAICYLIGYIGKQTKIKLPADCHGKNYAIYQRAFQNCSNLTSITISDGVTCIGAYAFYSCDGLTSITIPNNVTCVGAYAFSDCSNLMSITTGNSVTSIGEDAFDECYKLVEVYNLSMLDITSGVSQNGCVGKYALDIYTDLSAKSKLWTTDDGFVFYEDGKTCYLMGYIGEKDNITLPTRCHGKNYTIYEHAFSDCDSLTDVTISNGVTYCIL